MNLRLNWKKYDVNTESALFGDFTIEVTYSPLTAGWAYEILNTDMEIDERGFPFDSEELAKQESEAHLKDYIQGLIEHYQRLLNELDSVES